MQHLSSATPEAKIQSTAKQLADFCSFVRQNGSVEHCQAILEKLQTPLGKQLSKLLPKLTRLLDKLPVRDQWGFFNRDEPGYLSYLLTTHRELHSFFSANAGTLSSFGKLWNRYQSIQSTSESLMSLSAMVADASRAQDRFNYWLCDNPSHANALKAFNDEIAVTLGCENNDESDLSYEWNRAIRKQNVGDMVAILSEYPALVDVAEKHISALEGVSQAWFEFKERQQQGASSPTFTGMGNDFDSTLMTHSQARDIINLTYALRQRYHTNLEKLLSLKEQHDDPDRQSTNPFSALTDLGDCDYLAPDNTEATLHDRIDLQQLYKARANEVIDVCNALSKEPAATYASALDAHILSEYYDNTALHLRKLATTSNDVGSISTLVSNIHFTVLSNAYTAAHASQHARHPASAPSTPQPKSMMDRVTDDARELFDFLIEHKQTNENDFLCAFEQRFAFHPLVMVLDIYNRHEDPLHIYQVSRRFQNHTRFLDSQFILLLDALGEQAARNDKLALQGEFTPAVTDVNQIPGARCPEQTADTVTNAATKRGRDAACSTPQQPDVTQVAKAVDAIIASQSRGHRRRKKAKGESLARDTKPTHASSPTLGNFAAA